MAGKKLAIIILINLFIATFPVLSTGYIIYLLYRTITFIVLAVAWNMVSGMTGHVSLGHGVFWGVGSYITAFIWFNGLNPFFGVLLGGFIAIMVAITLIPVFRLKGAYLAIGTLSLNFGMLSIYVNLKEFGGAGGLHLPILQHADIVTYYLMYILALCVLTSTFKIVHSRYGFAIKALSDEEAAEIIGVDTFKIKTGVFLLSALFFGLAGGVNALNTVFISPYTAFDITWSVYPVFMGILGGVGTLFGPIIGAIIMTLTTEILSLMATGIDRFLYGVMLIILILCLPEGVVPRIRKYLLKQK